MERAKQKRPLGNYKNLIKMLEKHKQPSLEAGLLIILVVVSIISIGYYSEGKAGIAQITGKMVKVTGMDVKYFVYQNNEWKSVTAPPTTGNYMIETSSGKYLFESGKYYKLQASGWDRSQDYTNEVKAYFAPPPSTQYKLEGGIVKESTDGTTWTNSQKTSEQLAHEGYVQGTDGKFTKSVTPTTSTTNQPLILRRGSNWVVKDSTGKENTYTDLPSAKNKFVEEMRTYLKGKIDEAQASATAQIARNYNDQIERVLAEMSRSTSTDISYYNGKIAQVERLVDEMNAKLRLPSEQATYLSPTASELDRTTAQNLFNQNPNNEEIMKALADASFQNDYAKELLARLAFENGKESEAYKQLAANLNLDNTQTKVDAALAFKANIQKLDPSAATKLSIDSNGQLYDTTNYKYVELQYTISSGRVVFQYKDTGPTLIAGKPVELTGLAYVAANLAEGYTVDKDTQIVKDTKGNVYGKINEIEFAPTEGGKFQPTDKFKTAPVTLSDGTPLTLKEGYLVGDQKVYEAGGKLYGADTDWTKATRTNLFLTNQVVRATEPIGDINKNGIVIRKTIKIDGNGVMSGKEGDIAIVPSRDLKDNNFNNDIPIDTETLSMIKSTVNKGGTISTTGNQNSGSTISFLDRDGREISKVSYSPNYKIEANKLTGIKSQTDFAYTQDINHDGKISEDEKNQNPVKYITGFTATQEINGKLDKMWYADRFRFGTDNYYFADVIVQKYKWNEQNQRVEPDGDVEYYYVEGSGEDLRDIQLKIENGELTAIQGNVVKIVNGKAVDATGDLAKRAENRAAQWSSRRWFADFEFKLTQFRGLAGWSQLIVDKETLAEWREGVDKLFSTFYLGTDYWSSEICSKYIPKQQKGLLTMKTKDGLFDIVAHVEGERTLIPKPDGTKQYIYKLTLAVRNPKYSSYDKLQFNVYLYGEKTVKLYEQDISVEDGKSFTRGTGEMEDGQVTYTQEHGKPIVQYSDFLYNKICIKFTHSITNAEGSSEDEVCNSIVEYKGSPTKYQQRTTPTTPGTQATPGEPYQEADF